MRTTFLIIVCLHGLLHLLGFVKGYGLKEVKELTLPISKTMGVLWLAAALLMLAYGIAHALHARYAWLIGLVAVLLSQILVIAFWKDAKFGTVPNVAIILVSLVALGQFQFEKLVQGEVRQMLSDSGGEAPAVVAESDMGGLPTPVQNWLRHSGALGAPYMHMGRVSQKAEMQMKPGQEQWMSATALQYTAFEHPAFIWTVDAQMNALLHFKGRDKFENGKGEMLIKLNSLLNVVHARGEKLDEGSLQRFLGEMVWFPSLALSPYITWEQINDTTATASMDYMGSTGSGTFHFTPAGDVARYTALRYHGNEPAAKRHLWTMDIEAYKTFEGIRVPAIMTSTWELEEGPWTWLKLEVTDIRYNENVIPY